MIFKYFCKIIKLISTSSNRIVYLRSFFLRKFYLRKLGLGCRSSFRMMGCKCFHRRSCLRKFYHHKLGCKSSFHMMECRSSFRSLGSKSSFRSLGCKFCLRRSCHRRKGSLLVVGNTRLIFVGLGCSVGRMGERRHLSVVGLGCSVGRMGERKHLSVVVGCSKYRFLFWQLGLGSRFLFQSLDLDVVLVREYRHRGC